MPVKMGGRLAKHPQYEWLIPEEGFA